MFSNLKLSVTSTIDTVYNTPFAKDVRKGGVFGLITASIEGIERERLKSEIDILEQKYRKTNDLNAVLVEYDEFSKSFKYRDTVLSIRNRMVNRLEKINKEIQTNTNDFVTTKMVYVLELENGKYFVGSSEQLETCYEQHKNGGCHEFTTKYTPVKILEQTLTMSKYDEVNMVYKYMEKYGVSNVRGGPYQSINMSASEAMELQKLLMHTNEKKINFDDGFNLDSTVIATFVMHDFGKFTVDEIAQMRSMKDTTILTHLEKCERYNVTIV
jgi:predicted GIY-YIG superfamily endonuclease